jgi:hypothetical protein
MHAFVRAFRWLQRRALRAAQQLAPIPNAAQ